jgi:hypothetical protein
VALGEHYLIDLVVAFPFLLGMQAAWSTGVPWRAACRLQAIIAGFAATAVWFVALRWAIPAFLSSSALGWMAIAITVGGAVWLEQRLADALWQRQTSSAPHVSKVLCPEF